LDSAGLELFVAKLRSHSEVSPEQESALIRMPRRQASLPRGGTILHEGTRQPTCFMVATGVLSRYRTLRDGTSQICGFQLPGDMPDLHALILNPMDHAVRASTESTILVIDQSALLEALEAHPSLCTIFWRETLVDAAIFREWTANVGARNALSRIAHLLCEIYVRMNAIGRVRNRMCHFPVTQQTIAEATGLSLVHINRSMQVLRKEGLVELTSGYLKMQNWDRLADVAEFDTTYLHLGQEAVRG
jgi:CRP-like cAMP-binding protein